MLSDESSSDSETGRFKCQTKSEENQSKPSTTRDRFKTSSRSRPSENDRFRREFGRKNDDRDRHIRPRSRDRPRQSRRSPVSRRFSRERSPKRRSHERQRHGRYSSEKSKTKDNRNSRDCGRHSRSRSHKKSPDLKRDLKEEIIKTITPKDKTPEKKSDVDKSSSSPDYRGKKSEIHKPLLKPVETRKSDSPIIVEEYDNNDDHAEVVQPGSYYKMIPAVVKEKSEESSEIDSSDDERLRAKLLNLEKELHKTRKKKHRKKHKQKSSKTKKDKDSDATAVEVTSTTDIPDENTTKNSTDNLSGTPEVTSTQKSHQKDSSEEGEILSDDSQNPINIDPSDLRHKIKRHKVSEQDVCGPALPPHLLSRFARSKSREMEGPALPPTLGRKAKNIGPSIPDDMREVLATREREVIEYESSDEDVGIGPLPTGSEAKWSDAHKRLEERALEIQINNMGGDKKSHVKSREKWMLELPEGKTKYLGLEARTFRAKEGPDMSDRSTWTDTPEDKARKAAGIAKPENIDEVLKRDAKAQQIANRDEEQESAVKKHKKKHKRDESLLELHQKKLKKKKKKEEKESDGKQVRRPFSRDVDLQVNRFDEAQKKAIIKKSQHLDSRFSRGEAKYL